MSAVEGSFLKKIGILILFLIPLVILGFAWFMQGFGCGLGMSDSFGCTEISPFAFIFVLAAGCLFLILMVGIFTPFKMFYKIIRAAYFILLATILVSIILVESI